MRRVWAWLRSLPGRLLCWGGWHRWGAEEHTLVYRRGPSLPAVRLTYRECRRTRCRAWKGKEQGA
jgi:hypothetical protein